ncbi:WAT1-related protein At1g68170-like isoform X2 [Lotus japonicus]|uniref:WAT1-related protein At1g68170-like isoform X2 n=1 Tax=Lotus japonicus TaxID=34305 RepID=UPI00258E3F72|nr:WAT1-related protein At1g68170-like isoform X2 [Lotus japonicus]
MGKIMEGLKPALLMVFVQIAYAATNIVYKLAINDGMSMTVATAYRLIFASTCTIPLALIFDRKKRPKITWRVLVLAFLCGMFGGSLFLNLYAVGLGMTSATFMLAVVNLIPGITFILATCFGLEKLNLGAAAGKAKVIGTIVGISGAMVLTFLKGFEINILSSKLDLMHPHHDQSGHIVSQHVDFSNKALGIPCALASCISFSLWLITQAKMNQEYPSPHSSSALMCIMGALQSTIIALCFERDWSQWKLGFDIRLLTVAYSGIVGSGLVVIVIAWCVKMRGPLFASIFNPLQLLLVAIAAYLLLDEKLYLGSVLGAVLIVIGLYAVLWGKSKEMKTKTQLMPVQNTTESQVIEVAVISTPVNQHKCVHCNQCQVSATSNVADDQSLSIEK